MTVKRELRELLVCPKCRGPLDYQEEGVESFVCPACALRYRVEDGVPVMLVEEAERLSGD